MNKESWYARSISDVDVVTISYTDDWSVDYDKSRGMYRVSYFEDNHFVDEHWFDAYEDKEVRRDFPRCSVGDIVWYTFYCREPEKCKVSMLQQKADKSWKIRLSPQDGVSGVFDMTLERFNKYCFYTEEEAWNKINDKTLDL